MADLKFDRGSALTVFKSDRHEDFMALVISLVIALLAQAPEKQLLLAREMAVHISPRPGFTRHRLTLHAADEMLSLVDRARRFRPGHPR